MAYLIIFSLLITNMLNAMDMQTAIDLALKQNNKLKQSQLNIQNTQLQKELQKSKNYGKVDFSASYEYYNNARTLIPLTPMDIVSSKTGAYEIPSTNNMMNTGIAYNVVLFDGFAQKNLYKISDLSHNKATFETKLAKEELIYNVRSLYLSILNLQEQLEARKTFTQSEEKLFDRIKIMFNLGSKSRLDLLKAKNTLIISQSNEIKIKENLKILKASMEMLLAIKEFDKAEVLNISMSELKQSNTTYEQLSKYKVSEVEKNIANKKIQKASSSYYPTLNLNSYYGVSFGPNATQNTYPATGETFIKKDSINSENIWQFGLKLNWNIYDFGVKSTSVQKEKIALISQELSANNTKLEFKKNLKTAYAKLSLSLEDFKVSQNELELLDEILKAENIKYENNALALDDLLLSKAKRDLAYVKMIGAKYNYQRAKYYIDYLYEKGENKQ